MMVPATPKSDATVAAVTAAAALAATWVQLTSNLGGSFVARVSAWLGLLLGIAVQG
jgi:hypothetical protein